MEFLFWIFKDLELKREESPWIVVQIMEHAWRWVWALACWNKLTMNLEIFGVVYFEFVLNVSQWIVLWRYMQHK